MSSNTPMAAFERQPCRYSAQDWEKAKPIISRLYITENKTIKEVITALEGELGMVTRYGSQPCIHKCQTNANFSEKQLKSRLTKWNLDIKNLKGETIIRLARTREKRKLENKETSFRICKRVVEEHKIDRYLRRKDISADDLLDMASPVNGEKSASEFVKMATNWFCEAPSPAFSVFTPPPARCSPTPDLGFASLSIQTDYTDAVQANQLQVDETETEEFQTEYTNVFQANEVQANEIETDESDASPASTILLKTSTSFSAKFPMPEIRYQYRKRIVQEIGDCLRNSDISISILHASLSHAKGR